MLHAEFSRILELYKEELAQELLQNWLVSLIPRQTEIDPILRCETHLSHLIEKTISFLMQLKASGN
jgi:hypothetical protein